MNFKWAWAELITNIKKIHLSCLTRSLLIRDWYHRQTPNSIQFTKKYQTRLGTKNTENHYIIDALVYSIHSDNTDISYCDNLTIWLIFWQFDWHYQTDLKRSWLIWSDFDRSGRISTDLGRSQQIWGDLNRSGQISTDLGRFDVVDIWDSWHLTLLTFDILVIWHFTYK